MIMMMMKNAGGGSGGGGSVGEECIGRHDDEIVLRTFLVVEGLLLEVFFMLLG